LELAYSAAFAAAWGFRPVFRLAFERAALEHTDTSLKPARVLAEHRGSYDIITPDGPSSARSSGRLRHHALDRAEHPAVGDWVLVEPGSIATIVAVLERQTHITRQAAGKRTEPQVLAANVDTVFIVTSANEDFSPRRIERYRHAIASGGAQPVVVLNKSDLVDDDELHAMRQKLPVDLALLTLSALTGDGTDALNSWMSPGDTVALLGSSGVGKSTLVNRLCGAEVMVTNAIRSSDATGQHTTTHRQLLQLPDGGLLIDTPGMRELQLWAPDDGDTDDDPVRRFAEDCRFRDCSHANEPGCAVRAAYESGELTHYQLEAHDQLQRELAYQRRRQDQFAARAEVRKWKQITKDYRRRPDKKL